LVGKYSSVIVSLNASDGAAFSFAPGEGLSIRIEFCVFYVVHASSVTQIAVEPGDEWDEKHSIPALPQ